MLYHKPFAYPLLALASFSLGSWTSTQAATTALDRYVHTPDPAYDWQLAKKLPGKDYQAFVVEMVSQSWLTTREVDQPIWKHWLTIILPAQVEHETALLFVGGGRNGRPAPEEVDDQLANIAVSTSSVVCHLGMVPNQPLIFGNDGKQRNEDEIIAYTWDKFLRTGDERWPARLPMTKSVVRAMDTITAFCASPEGRGLVVDKFFVAGGSKRGWTTWTTAAVDRRVVAIAPIVIDLLNLGPSFRHHFEVYGFYAPAVQDYEAMGIMNWMQTPEYHRLLELVEPFEYRERFKMPKFIINATGDQFFVPDSSQFYYRDLPEPKYLRYVPNGEHSLEETDAFETLATSYYAVLNDLKLPEVTWQRHPDGTLEAQASAIPTTVSLWQASNPTARDFRVDTIGRTWQATRLTPNEAGRYLGSVRSPAQGWTAFLIEFTFEPPNSPGRLKLTTEVSVLPKTKPHPYTPPAQHPVTGKALALP